MAELAVESARLGDALRDLRRRLPALGPVVSAAGALSPHCAVSLNGLDFVRDPDTPLRAGDQLVLLSADAGG